MKKSIHMLRTVNTKLGLKVTGIYIASQVRAARYMSVEIRYEKYWRHKCLGQAEKSIVAKHRSEIGHGTSTIDQAPGWIHGLPDKEGCTL
jgi:hypothetical protein